METQTVLWDRPKGVNY